MLSSSLNGTSKKVVEVARNDSNRTTLAATWRRARPQRTMKERRTLSSRLLTMKQAVVYLNIPLDTLYKMVSQGRIPVVKVTRNNMFDPVMLDKWIKEHTKLPIST